MKYFALFILFVYPCDGYNVLIATPTAVKSESSIMLEVALGLADAGHSVTFMTGFTVKRKHPNLRVVIYEEIEKAFDDPNVNSFVTPDISFQELIQPYYNYQNKLIWGYKKTLSIWENRKDFHLFITLSYYSEGMFPFLMENDIPFVQVCTPGSESLALSREGNWLSTAAVPSLMGSFDERMNFWERSRNVIDTIHFYYSQNRIIEGYISPVREVFPDLGDYHSYYDRVALTLINGNFALDSPVPLLPSQIEIGTINAKKSKPLEKNLKKFVDSAGEEGIIYFSLGSIAKSADIPSQAKEVFLEAFRRVPQKVLWKYEGTDLDLPPNVLTQKWMPQQDILGHPKTKVFISHCGNLGTQEAKYHGVPVLALPIAFDQPRNAARMERKGYAHVLEWENLTVEKVLDKLNILINNTEYQDRMDAVSRIVQDQKESPVDRAVWWLEYLVRHKGAPHLQYAGRRLSLFQYVMLDVILFWSAVLLVIVLAVVCGVRAVCCRGAKGEDRRKQTIKKKQ